MMDKLRFKIYKNLLIRMCMISDYEIALRCKTDLVRIDPKYFNAINKLFINFIFYKFISICKGRRFFEEVYTSGEIQQEFYY